MNFNDNDVTAIKSTIKHGMFLHAITIIVGFCAQHNKTAVLSKLEEFIASFNSSASAIVRCVP